MSDPLKSPTIPIPRHMQQLPEARGFKVPWFVRWYGDTPEFRVMDAEKFRRAIREHLCWVCGNQLIGTAKCFVIGPMCAVNRISSEPPSHPDCARYSAQACPFLSRPHAIRRPLTEDPGKPGQAPDAHVAGILIERNPGVTLLWFTSTYKVIQVPNGLLFQIGRPAGVEWYCEGRKATRDEVLESIRTGLPTLNAAAQIDGPGAVAAIAGQLARAMRLVPTA